MGKKLAAAVLPITLLWGCGTRLVWQGPPGTAQQDLAETRSECQHQAEAWRTYNVQVYQQTNSQTDVTGQQSAPDDLYRTADQLFERCMIAQGYKLVPQGQ